MIHSSVGEIKTTNSNFNSNWPPIISGNGVIAVGKVIDLRNHNVQDSKKKYHRYIAILLQVEVFRKRIFDSKNVEVDWTIGGEKRVGIGYLNKYDHKEVQDPNEITEDGFRKLIGGQALPLGYFDEQKMNLDPYQKGVFEFWGEVSFVKSMDLKKDQKIKLKTKGDSIFIESVGKTQDNFSSNYSGENVLGGWTTKINQADKTSPVEEKQGVDASEWD